MRRMPAALRPVPAALLVPALLLGLAGAGPVGAGGLVRIHAAGFEAFACQDGVRQEAEQCDDGDADDSDGCTSQCRRAAPCDAGARPGGDRFAVDPARGACYVLAEQEITTWEAANTACLALGGHLASLTSAAEVQTVLPLLAGGAKPWIGIGDERVEGEFAWLTGEPTTLLSFAAGQPDGDGDCAYMRDPDGAWADVDCGGAGAVDARLCEIEPP